jgi:hypothetical protein
MCSLIGHARWVLLTPICGRCILAPDAQSRTSASPHGQLGCLHRYWNLGLAFVIALLIAGVSSYIGIRKVLKIEPFDIYRG